MLSKYIPKYRNLQTITHVYPDKIKHTQLKHAVMLHDEAEQHNTRRNENMTPDERAEKDIENLERSLRRTQAEIADIIDCNNFEWFGTLTTDPKKIDRYNDNEVIRRVSTFLNNLRRKSPDLNYLLVPERHKDGALHFHALFGHLDVDMSDSGRKWHGEPIYNLKSYTWGFSDFTRIKDKARTANYCRKYITKEMLTERKNKKRYWCTKNLKKPERIENLELMELVKQNKNLDLIHLKAYENEHVSVTTFPIKQKMPE